MRDMLAALLYRHAVALVVVIIGAPVLMGRRVRHCHVGIALRDHALLSASSWVVAYNRYYRSHYAALSRV